LLNFIRNIIKKNDFQKIDFGEEFDLFGQQVSSNRRFLNTFTEKDILKLMEKSGLSDFLKKRKIENTSVRFKYDDNMVNQLQVYFNEYSDDNVIIDLRLSESKYLPKKEGIKLLKQTPFEVIVVEWLQTRDPFRKEFPPNKPPLPGQPYPSLGCLGYLMMMMYFVAKIVTKDAFLDIPDHLHLSLMYAKKFKFLNPENEGTIRAIIRDLEDHRFSDVAWGSITKTIIVKNTGQPYIYIPAEQVFPISGRMNKYFHSREYKETVKRFKNVKYEMDYPLMVQRREDLLKKKKISEL